MLSREVTLVAHLLQLFLSEPSSFLSIGRFFVQPFLHGLAPIVADGVLGHLALLRLDLLSLLHFSCPLDFLSSDLGLLLALLDVVLRFFLLEL